MVLAILTGLLEAAGHAASRWVPWVPDRYVIRTSNRDVQLSSNSLTFHHVVVMLSSIMKSFPKSPTIAVLRRCFLCVSNDGDDLPNTAKISSHTEMDSFLPRAKPMFTTLLFRL